MSWELDKVWDTLHTGHVIVLATAGLTGYYVVKNIFKPKYRLPPGPRRLPILGNLMSLSSEPMFLTFTTMAEKYGDIFTVYLGPNATVILNSNDVMCEALYKKAVEFADRPLTATFEALGGKDTIAFGLYNPVLKLQRRIAMSGLRKLATGKPLEGMIQRSFLEANAMIEKENGKPFNIVPVVSLMVYNVVASMVFGKTYEPDDPFFAVVLAELDQFIASVGNGLWADLYPVLGYLPNPKLKPAEAFLKKFSDVLRESWQEHQESYNPDEMTDFLYLLISVKKEIEKEEGADATAMLEEKHYTGILLDMFFGGIGTTRLTLDWAVLLLASYQDIQAKVQKEIDDVVGRHQMIGNSHRPHMPYTEAVLLEAMRLYPASPLSIPRATSCDVEIRGYTIPKGTWVMANLWAIFRDPNDWEEADKFIPERHLDENGNISPKSNNFLPFGIGRRACVGESTARVNLHLLLSMLFQRYTITPPPGETLNLESIPSLQLHPVPYRVVATPRG